MNKPAAQEKITLLIQTNTGTSAYQATINYAFGRVVRWYAQEISVCALTNVRDLSDPHPAAPFLSREDAVQVFTMLNGHQYGLDEDYIDSELDNAPVPAPVAGCCSA